MVRDRRHIIKGKLRGICSCQHFYFCRISLDPLLHELAHNNARRLLSSPLCRGVRKVLCTCSEGRPHDSTLLVLLGCDNGEWWWDVDMNFFIQQFELSPAVQNAR